MKNWFNKNKYLLIMLFVSIFVIYGAYIFCCREFLFNADQRLQYNYFYEEWLNLIDNFIKRGEFPFYSWNTFLGSNFYASKAYYVVGDIFLPFLYLMKDNLNAALMIESFTLIIISGVFFSSFMREYGFKKERVILILSLTYALSGTATIFVGQYMFHRFYAFFPMLLWGVERAFNKQKYGLFISTVFLLFITNYYLMFPATLFLPLYFWHTWIRRYPFKIKAFLFRAILMIGAYLIGFFMSCVLVLPAILFVLGNTRLGDYNTWNIFWEFKVYMGFLFSYITPPATLYTTIPYIFVSGFNGHDYWYSIYASVLGCAALFTSLFYSGRKYKISTVIPYLILIAVAFFKPFSSIMHGFSQPSFRWSYLILVFGLLLSGYSLEKMEEEPKQIIKGYLIYVSLYIIYLILGFINGTIVLPDHNYHLLLSLFFLFLGILYCVVLYAKKFKLLVFLVFIELCLSMGVTTLNLSKDYREYTPSLDKNILKYWQDVDQDLMFRIYTDPDKLMPISDMNKNQSLPLSFMSTSTYDSTYEPSLSEFLKNNAINWHNINLNSNEQLKMLGVKYILVKDQEELPAGLDLTKAFEINEYQAWKMNDFKSIGYTFSQYVNEELVNPDHLPSWEWNEELRNNLEQWPWSTKLIIPSDLFKELRSNDSPQIPLTITEKYANGLKGYIEVPEKTILFLSIPYSKGWKATDNLEFVPIYKVNNGFIGMVLESGVHEIQLNFTPEGFKLGTLISCIGSIVFVFLVIFENKEKLASIKKIDEEII